MEREHPGCGRLEKPTSFVATGVDWPPRNTSTFQNQKGGKCTAKKILAQGISASFVCLKQQEARARFLQISPTANSRRCSRIA
jgi:hypothetical protein